MKKQAQKRIPCEVYSRIVGYYRPVQNWNVGKKQEFMERKTYDKSLYGEERNDNQKLYKDISC